MNQSTNEFTTNPMKNNIKVEKININKIHGQTPKFKPNLSHFAGNESEIVDGKVRFQCDFSISLSLSFLSFQFIALGEFSNQFLGIGGKSLFFFKSFMKNIFLMLN